MVLKYIKISFKALIKVHYLILHKENKEKYEFINFIYYYYDKSS